MKTVYSYQELATLISQGKPVLFTCPVVAWVRAVTNYPDNDVVTVSMELSIRDTCVGIVEGEYSSILTLLEAFDLDERAEIWEVLNDEHLWGNGPSSTGDGA